MKRLVEYKIISGNVMETRRSYMALRSKPEEKSKRAPRVAGNSSEKKIKANELSSARELARVLNCNFGAGDVHIVLKYPGNTVPTSYEAAEEHLKKILAKLRYEFKKQHNINPQMVWVTANWSPHRKAPARLHHHLVVEASAFDIVRKLWPEGLSAEFLDSRADHSDLAGYLVDNVNGRPNKKKWSCSRNMARPTYTEPELVDDVEDVRPEKNAIIKEYTPSVNDDGRVISTYLRCVLPVTPKVRGGKVIMPRCEKAKNDRREANDRKGVVEPI